MLWTNGEQSRLGRLRSLPLIARTLVMYRRDASQLTIVGLPMSHSLSQSTESSTQVKLACDARVH